MIRKIKYVLSSMFLSKREKYLLDTLKTHSLLKLESQSQVLIEFNPVYSNIIGLFFFLRELRKVNTAKFNSYIIRNKSLVNYLTTLKTKRFYRAFGISEFFWVDKSVINRDEINNYFNDVFKKVKTKKELEDLHFDNVWVGDIIYDSYLMKRLEPTLELGSKMLEEEVKDAISYYIFWKKYFDLNEVKAVIVSHTVYSHFTMISRLAIARNIEVFQVNDAGLYRLSKDRTHAYVEFEDLKMNFLKLDPELQKKGIEWAKSRFELKFGGVAGVDMRYSKKSAWGEYDSDIDIIKPSNKIKIFIALHCFFDSPHSYGNNLFPDFYEWLDFVGKVSEKTNYEWYLKTHPDFLPANLAIVDFFVKKYPKFKLLPSDTSHHYIIKSGINFLLTVYGTIGSEYAYFGIPVINASVKNPHIAFDFNIHPRSIEEYEKILLNLENLNFKINKEEIFQFYFMRFFVYKQSWIWGSYDKMLDFIQGQNNLGTDIVIDYLKEFELNNLFEMTSKIANEFIKSDEYCIVYNKDTLKL